MTEPYSPSEYLEKLKGLEVHQILFVKLHAEVFPEHFFSGDLGLKYNDAAKIMRSESNTNFAILNNLHIKGFVGEEVAVDIELDVLGSFSIETGVDDEFLRVFKQQTAKLIMHPYMRKSVHDLSQQLGIEPIVLPIWKAPRTNDEADFSRNIQAPEDRPAELSEGDKIDSNDKKNEDAS